MTIDAAQQWMMLFTLVLTRVSAVLMTAPVFGAYSIPATVRALLAVSISAIITPMQSHVAVPSFATFTAMAPVLAEELITGLCLGLGAQLLFMAAQVAGQLAGQMGGLQMADTFNPASGTTSPLFAQVLDMTALGTFVLIGGPGQILTALLATFNRVPPGQAEMPVNFLEYYVALLASGFELGIRMGAPIILSLLIAILLLGLIGRTVPQLNVLQVSFNVNAAVLLVAIALTLNAGVWMVSEHFESQLDQLMEGAVGGRIDQMDT